MKAIVDGGTEKKIGLVVTYNYGLNDPPIRQAAESLASIGYQVTLLQSPARGVFPSAAPRGIGTVEYWVTGKGGGLKSLARWIGFCMTLRRVVRRIKPDVVIAIQPQSSAAMPKLRANQKLMACIYDIFVPGTMGRLDRWIFQRGFDRLKRADLVWCSDRFRAELTRDIAKLKSIPQVCHNCPPRSYFAKLPASKDPWLRKELAKRGAPVNLKGGACIMVRAGAIGQYCGLEETLDAMQALPENHIFLMMGRPSEEYQAALNRKIDTMGLRHRAFIWNLPSDEIWKKAIKGADIGHVIHGPFLSPALLEQYRVNSSLSNNRIFQYMAAGLPILSYDDPRMSALYDEVGCFRSARLSALREDIESHWRELGASAALRRRMGRRARRAHLEKYCWEKQFAPLLKAIHSGA